MGVEVEQLAEGEGFQFENWLPVFQGNFKHRYHPISVFLGRNTTFPVSEFDASFFLPPLLSSMQIGLIPFKFTRDDPDTIP